MEEGSFDGSRSQLRFFRREFYLPQAEENGDKNTGNGGDDYAYEDANDDS